MYTVLLKFNGLPQIGFAHHYYYTQLHTGGYGKEENNFELVYVKSGEIIFELYGQKFKAQPGSVFLLLRHLPVRIWGIGEHCSVQLFMNFELKIQDEAEGVPENFSGIVLPMIMPPSAETEGIKKELYSIVSQTNTSRETAGLAVSLAAAGILEKINRYYRGRLSAAGQGGSILSYKIKKHIAGNIHREIPLEEVAVVLDKTPNYLNSVFKQANGITIHQYISREKVRVIAELMQDKGLSFRSACENVAIVDVSYGYRLFKKHTGMTPGEYLAGKRYLE